VGFCRIGSGSWILYFHAGRELQPGLFYLFPEGGWVLSAALGYFLTSFDWAGTEKAQAHSGSAVLAVTGIFLVFTWHSSPSPLRR
jgi:hypothetical protein